MPSKSNTNKKDKVAYDVKVRMLFNALALGVLMLGRVIANFIILSGYYFTPVIFDIFDPFVLMYVYYIFIDLFTISNPILLLALSQTSRRMVLSLIQIT